MLCLLVGVMVLLFHHLSYARPLRDIKQWTAIDILYGFFKLFRPILKAQRGKGIEDFFAKQNLDFTPPSGFQPHARATIGAGGDIMHSVGFNEHSLAHIWDDIGTFLFQNDIVFANLETPLDPSKPPQPVEKGNKLSDWMKKEAPRLNGSWVTLQSFFQDGGHLDIISTASNHCLNMGLESLRNTLDFLDTKGIPHVGTARSPQEQDDIPILERNGIRIAFLAYTFSLNQDRPPAGEEYLANFLLLNEPETGLGLIKRHIAVARSKGADVIAASLHWGHDIEAYPVQNIIDRGHALIEAGIDIILGHHPHMLQPLEKYTCQDALTGETRSGLIAYSLSEILSYLHFLPISWLSCILKIEVSKGTINGRSSTCITDVKMLPFYKICRQTAADVYAFRQIDLRKTLNSLLHFRRVYNLTTNEILAMVRANDILEKHILPTDHTKILDSVE